MLLDENMAFNLIFCGPTGFYIPKNYHFLYRNVERKTIVSCKSAFDDNLDYFVLRNIIISCGSGWNFRPRWLTSRYGGLLSISNNKFTLLNLYSSKHKLNRVVLVQITKRNRTNIEKKHARTRLLSVLKNWRQAMKGLFSYQDEDSLTTN